MSEPVTVASSEPHEIDVAALLERVAAAPLSEEDRRDLSAALRKLAELTQMLARRDATIERLRRLVFGPKTEKKPTPKPVSNQSCTGDDRDASPRRRKGHGRNPASAYTGAELHECHDASLSPGQCCPACGDGKLYAIEPQSIVRLTGSVPVTAHIYLCDQLRCALCGEVFTAAPPEEVGEEKYDDPARAIIALIKYGTGMPFSRLARMQFWAGVPLPASVQWKLNLETATWLVPVLEELIRVSAQGRLLHNDDTIAKILGAVMPRGATRAPGSHVSPSAGELRAGADDPRPEDRSGVFTTGMVSFVGEHRVVLYMTGWRHAGENLIDVLEQREPDAPLPIQMCDALSRNYPAALRTILANCLAHGRREFVEIERFFPDQCSHVIDELAKVYKNDELARQRHLSDDARLAWHQAESKPIMDDLHAWMALELAERRVEDNSALGKAIKYMLKHWEKLTLFLRVAGAPLDNTECERALKLAVLHRKNALFFRTQRGAVVADIFMSLIGTATLAKKNPMHYLIALIANRTLIRSAPQDWMPWNYEATLAARAALATTEAA